MSPCGSMRQRRNGDVSERAARQLSALTAAVRDPRNRSRNHPFVGDGTPNEPLPGGGLAGSWRPRAPSTARSVHGQ